jgi:pimeloyl-ACP methyl ester carboxylesterase
MPVAMSGDVSIHYQDTGGSGPAILFLHEYAGDHRSWTGQLAALKDRYRCLAVPLAAAIRRRTAPMTLTPTRKT